MELETTKDLNSFFAGDTLDYGVSFNDLDGVPLNISGMTLTYTMKINRSDGNTDSTSLQSSVLFPDNDDSKNGVGSIEIPSSKTKQLITERWYQFDFQLIGGGKENTMGDGKVFVKQKVKS